MIVPGDLVMTRGNILAVHATPEKWRDERRRKVGEIHGRHREVMLVLAVSGCLPPEERKPNDYSYSMREVLVLRPSNRGSGDALGWIKLGSILQPVLKKVTAV